MNPRREYFEARLARLRAADKTLDGFEAWLLHRAYRPEQFPEARDCEAAWHLVREFRLLDGSQSEGQQ